MDINPCCVTKKKGQNNMAILIDGAKLAKEVKADALMYAKNLATHQNPNLKPGLAVVLVGDDMASKRYVEAKSKDCAECGVNCMTIMLPADTTPDFLLNTIKSLNHNDLVHGILIQMPLPKTFRKIDIEAVLAAIDPKKDVDCFTPANVGKLVTNRHTMFKPCTPDAIVTMIAHAIDPEIPDWEWFTGKHAVIINRSNIVGKPLAQLLLNLNATVTICHSHTENIKTLAKGADILVTAVGKPGFITPDFIKPGAVVIDVSMNRDENGKLCGDCTEQVKDIAGYITPVPGGVGPMTRAMLMKNVVTAANSIENQKGGQSTCSF